MLKWVLVAAPRKGLGGLISRVVDASNDRVKALLRSSSSGEAEDSPRGRSPRVKTAAAAPLAPLTAGLLNDSPATYALGGGAALAVRFGMCEVAGLGLHHIAPNVHHEPATRTACVFTGHLQNLDELADRYAGDEFGEGPTSPSSILRADPRQLAAATILRMYQKERSADPLVLLSELQGQFAFALFDGERRQVLAARDSSACEPLYYEIDEDGAVSLSNAQPAVPTGDGEGGYVQWAELPPGHLIAGRSPKVQQFALTPAQLSIRETYERSMDEDLSPRAFAVLADQQEDAMRQSLSDELRRSLSPERSGSDRGGYTSVF